RGPPGAVRPPRRAGDHAPGRGADRVRPRAVRHGGRPAGWRGRTRRRRRAGRGLFQPARAVSRAAGVGGQPDLDFIFAAGHVPAADRRGDGGRLPGRSGRRPAYTILTVVFWGIYTGIASRQFSSEELHGTLRDRFEAD